MTHKVDLTPHVQTSAQCPIDRGQKTAEQLHAREHDLPFSPLPMIPSQLRAAIEQESLKANNTYLEEFVEKYNICPFARAARRDGTAKQNVHYYDGTKPEFLIDLMKEIMKSPRQIVTQVIFPLIEVTPGAWRDYCHALTARAHACTGAPPTFAVAALHPLCGYTTESASSLLTLFRRSPDPTLQWVRLDALSDIYEHRGGGSAYVAPEDIPQLLANPVPATDLYERIADANQKTAETVGIASMETRLEAISLLAQNQYQSIISSSSKYLGTEE